VKELLKSVNLPKLLQK